MVPDDCNLGVHKRRRRLWECRRHGIRHSRRESFSFFRRGDVLRSRGVPRVDILEERRRHAAPTSRERADIGSRPILDRITGFPPPRGPYCGDPSPWRHAGPVARPEQSVHPSADLPLLFSRSPNGVGPDDSLPSAALHFFLAEFRPRRSFLAAFGRQAARSRVPTERLSLLLSARVACGCHRRLRRILIFVAAVLHLTLRIEREGRYEQSQPIRRGEIVT